LSHAITHVKAPRTLPPALVIALAVAFFVGVGALLARSMSAPPSTLDGFPAVHMDSGEQVAPAGAARPPRVPRDPGAPGRRF
jgi:hypothetical protein